MNTQNRELFVAFPAIDLTKMMMKNTSDNKTNEGEQEWLNPPVEGKREQLSVEALLADPVEDAADCIDFEEEDVHRCVMDEGCALLEVEEHHPRERTGTWELPAFPRLSTAASSFSAFENVVDELMPPCFVRQETVVGQQERSISTEVPRLPEAPFRLSPTFDVCSPLVEPSVLLSRLRTAAEERLGAETSTSGGSFLLRLVCGSDGTLGAHVAVVRMFRTGSDLCVEYAHRSGDFRAFRKSVALLRQSLSSSGGVVVKERHGLTGADASSVSATFPSMRALAFDAVPFLAALVDELGAGDADSFQAASLLRSLAPTLSFDHLPASFLPTLLATAADDSVHPALRADITATLHTLLSSSSSSSSLPASHRCSLARSIASIVRGALAEPWRKTTSLRLIGIVAPLPTHSALEDGLPETLLAAAEKECLRELTAALALLISEGVEEVGDAVSSLRLVQRCGCDARAAALAEEGLRGGGGMEVPCC